MKDKIIILDNSNLSKVTKKDIVIVIDAFRATTSMYYLMEKGIKDIYPVKSKEDALVLKKELDNVIIVGEEKGIKPREFDLNNSPTQILNSELENSNVIVCTSSGSKALYKFECKEMILGSFLNISKIVEYIKNRNNERVFIYPTNQKDDKVINEDYICAKYIKALVLGEKYDINKEILNIEKNSSLRFFKQDLQERFPKSDFYLATKIDTIKYILFFKNGKLIKR